MINIALQPKQIELYHLVNGNENSIIGYGGSAGGAKSHGIRDVSLIIACENGGMKAGIFRRVSKELTTNHIDPFFLKYPRLREYYNKAERILRLPNTSSIKFCSADKEDDIYSYQGDEYDIIFIDEATHFTQKMIEFLMTRNRTTLSNFLAKVVMTMNPGNIGHAYIKRIFIDKSYAPNEKADDYVFIPAKIYDNVIWCERALKEQGYTRGDYYEKWDDAKRKEFCYKYSDYVKRLKGLPYELMMAFLEGDWEVFGGQFFKTFDRGKEVIKPFVIPREWKLISSIDPGFSSPCSYGLTAQDFDGNVYRIATYYESERNPEQHAQGILDFHKTEVIRKLIGDRKPDLNIAGRDAWAKKDRYSILANEKTFADVFMEYGIYLTPAVTDRIPGWWAWKSLMPERYFIFDHLNTPLVRQITHTVTDTARVEDILGRGNDNNVEDHAIDEQRYGIMSLYKPLDTPKRSTPTGREEAVSGNKDIWSAY